MSADIDELKMQKLETMDRVKTLNKFQMPYYIRNDQLVLEQSYKFSEELIEYTRESLRKGFLQKKALFEVSCRVNR